MLYVMTDWQRGASGLPIGQPYQEPNLAYQAASVCTMQVWRL